jgi:hypothetical protein
MQTSKFRRCHRKEFRRAALTLSAAALAMAMGAPQSLADTPGSDGRARGAGTGQRTGDVSATQRSSVQASARHIENPAHHLYTVLISMGIDELVHFSHPAGAEFCGHAFPLLLVVVA